MRMTSFSLGKVLLLAAITGVSAWAQAPTGLSVKVATSKKIDLAWSGAAAGYTVQRRTLGGTYGNVATATTAAYSDTAIDAYTTYQYQIVANLASGASSPSNQVTVGPPPAGFSVAAQAPGAPGSDAANNYGYDLSMALDGNGDPAFAFVQQDPNLDNDFTDTQVLFRSWNRAAYTWNPVVKVATVGDSASSRNTVSLAYDSSTGVFAVFTEYNLSDGVRLYTSADGGATWPLKATYTVDGSGTYGPNVVLAGGNVYLASITGDTGARYITGKLSAAPATWQSKTAPTVAGATIADWGLAPSLVLDSAGNPGIAYRTDDTVNSY